MSNFFNIMVAIAILVVIVHISIRVVLAIYVLKKENFSFRRLISFPAIKRIARYLLRGLINTVISILTSTLFDFAIISSAFIFLWNFYCGIAEKIFIRPEDSDDNLIEDNSISVWNIINPSALENAISDFNLLILFFPGIFFSLALLFHYNKEEHKKVNEKKDGKKPRNWGLFWVGACTFVFDAFAAYVSLKIEHDDRSGTGSYGGTWGDFFTHYTPYFFLILFCGFSSVIIFGQLLSCLRTRLGISSSDEDLNSVIDSHLEELNEFGGT